MFWFWLFVGGAIGGASMGLIAAVGIRWARKQSSLPMWPILTGMMFGLLIALLELP